MVDGPKYVATIRRMRRAKSTRVSTSKSTSNKSASSKTQVVKKQKQKEGDKAEAVVEAWPTLPQELGLGGDSAKEKEKAKAHRKRESITVVEANVRVGASKSDFCLFAHFMIGFLRHLQTEWIQIVFEIEGGVTKEPKFEYLLLSDDPAMKTDQWKTVYTTWSSIIRIRIRVHEFPEKRMNELLFKHCDMLLQHFRAVGVKKACRWLWHPEEAGLLEGFLACEVLFFVGEEEKDGGQGEGGGGGAEEGSDEDVFADAREMVSSDAVLQGGNGASTESAAGVETDTVAESGGATIMTGAAAVKGEVAESGRVSHTMAVAESDGTKENKSKEAQKIQDKKPTKKNTGIKKLEVIWEEEAKPSELMKALRAVPMVETGGFCACFDRCWMNENLELTEIDTALAWPIRNRMRVRRRNFTVEHSPDRFLLRDRRFLEFRRA